MQNTLADRVQALSLKPLETEPYLTFNLSIQSVKDLTTPCTAKWKHITVARTFVPEWRSVVRSMRTDGMTVEWQEEHTDLHDTTYYNVRFAGTVRQVRRLVWWLEKRHPKI